MKHFLVQNAIPDAKKFIHTIRNYKINDYSVFDIFISYFVAYLMSILLKNVISRKRLFYLVLPISILIHTIFNVHTPLTDQFWDVNGYYLVKISILYMAIKGLNIDLYNIF